MEWIKDPVAQKLLQSFMQFHKADWHGKSIDGLKPSEVKVLVCIKKGRKKEESDIKVSEISRLLRVTAPTVTQLINSLEDNGLVERSADKSDRRSVRIKLTDKGEKVVGKASRAFAESFNGLVNYLGEEDSTRLAELLSKTFLYFNSCKNSCKEEEKK